MSAFSESVEELQSRLGHQSETRPAPATLLLKPDAFAEDWPLRPKTPVLFGLRVPCDQDIQSARAEAAKTAVELHDDPDGRIEAFNDALLSALVARALCDPNDVNQPHPLLELPDELVPVALKSKTIEHIYDAVERLHVSQSPLYEEATDEEVAELVQRLMAGGLELLPAVKAKRARRFLRFVLDDLR